MYIILVREQFGAFWGLTVFLTDFTQKVPTMYYDYIHLYSVGTGKRCRIGTLHRYIHMYTLNITCTSRLGLLLIYSYKQIIKYYFEKLR